MGAGGKQGKGMGGRIARLRKHAFSGVIVHLLALSELSLPGGISPENFKASQLEHHRLPHRDTQASRAD